MQADEAARKQAEADYNAAIETQNSTNIWSAPAGAG